MNKLNNFVLRYILWSLPFVVLLFLGGSIVDPAQVKHGSIFLQLLWSALGFNLMLWFLMVVYFIVYLIFSAKAREMLLAKLAGIKERDERESFIAGRAAKATFLSSIVVLTLLLFLSIFSFDVEMVELDPIKNDGKTHELVGGISITLKALDTWPENTTKISSVDNKYSYLSYQGIPITKTGIIILLLIWQLGAYHYFARQQRE